MATLAQIANFFMKVQISSLLQKLLKFHRYLEIRLFKSNEPIKKNYKYIIYQVNSAMLCAIVIMVLRVGLSILMLDK